MIPDPPSAAAAPPAPAAPPEPAPFPAVPVTAHAPADNTFQKRCKEKLSHAQLKTMCTDLLKKGKILPI